MINPEMAFLRELRTHWNLWACHEVNSYYGCLADVLAIDHNKKIVCEFEFKRSSQDLKINEPKKEKYKLQKQYRYIKPKDREVLYGNIHYNKTCLNYKQEPLKPHKFYFVIPRELWEKEKDYLNSFDFEGTIVWDLITNEHNHMNFIQFTTVKKAKIRKKNTYNYETVAKDILSRATSYIAYSQKISEKEEINEKD